MQWTEETLRKRLAEMSKCEKANFNEALRSMERCSSWTELPSVLFEAMSILGDPPASPPSEQAFNTRADEMAVQAQRREQIRLMIHTLTNWSLGESQREAARVQLAAILERLESGAR